MPGGGQGEAFVMPWAEEGDMQFDSNSKKQDILEAMVNPDEFYYYGHGRPGSDLCIDTDGNLVITTEDIDWVIQQRKQRNKGKMRRIEVRSCWSCRLASKTNQWLELSDYVLGFSVVTAEAWPPHLNLPMTFRKPVSKNPGVDFLPQIGPSKDELPGKGRKKSRLKAGKGKT